ncbi:MAG: ribosome maturation factor RimM [Bacilli bacterium]
MEYIYIGDIVNTHGIKGELRILSDFKYKKNIFKKEFKLYIGLEKELVIITKYRFHKIFDMICLNGYNDINEVLKFKACKVYVNKQDLDVPYLNEELIGISVYNQDGLMGKISDIRLTKTNEIFVINNNIFIPNIEQFVKKIDIKNKKVIVETINGMLNEN